MGSFGVRGGNFRAQNFQGDTVDITTDGSGNGSSTVTFRQKMKGTGYGVVITPNQYASEVWTTGITQAASKTISGCKIYVRGSSSTSTTVKVAYQAFDDNYR